MEAYQCFQCCLLVQTSPCPRLNLVACQQQRRRHPRPQCKLQISGNRVLNICGMGIFSCCRSPLSLVMSFENVHGNLSVDAIDVECIHTIQRNQNHTATMKICDLQWIHQAQPILPSKCQQAQFSCVCHHPSGYRLQIA